MIKFLSRKDCSKCNIIKKLMDSKKVDYEYIDIDNNEEYFNLLTSKNIFNLPVLEIDNELYSNYNDLIKMFKV